MRPFSNKVSIPMLIAEVVLLGFFIVERSGLGDSDFISKIFIMILTLISTIVATKAGINWEGNQEYQRKAKEGNYRN